MTTAQTLEVVCGLFENMRVVMEGEIIHYALSFGIHSVLNILPIRWQGIGRPCLGRAQ